MTIINVPGTSVTADVARWPGTNTWDYTLRDEQSTVLADGELDFSDSQTTPGLTVTPEQVARIAFLLECEYSTAPW